jgi:hypothetical protein
MQVSTTSKHQNGGSRNQNHAGRPAADHPTASSITRQLYLQSCMTSWWHHRAPRRSGRRPAPTSEELRQATITPANNHWTIRRRPQKPSEERPVLHCTTPCEVPESGKPPLYQDQINVVLFTHLCVFLSHPLPDLDN